MNRDYLIELLFGENPPPVSGRDPYRQIEEADEANPFVVHTRAVLGTHPRRYVVRREFAPGAGAGVAATTINTTEIAFIGVDPDYRGKGHARDLLAGLAEEAKAHALTLYLTTVTSDRGCVEFFEHFGFVHPERSPDGFLVFALTDEPWPPGTIMR